MSASGADVAVIGLGAIGSMALWRLAKRGVDLEALGLWHQLEEHADRELFRQTGGVILGPEGTPEIVGAAASASDNELPHETLGARD